MKKLVLIGLMLLLVSLVGFVSLVSGINLEVSEKPVSNAVIVDLDEPAVFDIEIRNLDETDSFEIYSLIGVDIFPEESFTIGAGEKKKIRIEIMPQESLKTKKGSLPFEYRIKNSKNEIQKEQIAINIVSLDEAFSITPGSVNPKSEVAVVSVKNNLMFIFDEVKIKLSSAFFEHEDSFSLGSRETKELGVLIDKEKLQSLSAGDYLVNIQVEVDGKTRSIESLIKFLEQENIETGGGKEGVLIKREEIIRKNIGNVKKTVEINAERNLFSYLFTTVNIAPSETKISSFKKQYTWKKELIPNEELKVVIKTNWFFPIIVVILIISIIYFVKRSVEADLVLRKKVSFVKTKGGQFALKVTIYLRSKKFIERINVIDKLPSLVNLYERFGAITPSKIDLQNRRLEWNVESLNEGEERLFTYIIYSRVGVIGRFELPNARAVYEKEGKVKETISNRSFFINEPKK